MFTRFLDYLLNLFFYHGKIGTVDFDRFDNTDGSQNVPDGYIEARPMKYWDDTRLPHERHRLVAISFSIENRYLADTPNQTLASQVHSKALVAGLNPVRVVMEGKVYTPFGFVEPESLVTKSLVLS